mmetsp:Transcript_6742/g.11620  ORF Transcript_6742/g.11620 Transcript_6742/m.11620 type:complete len:336 (+) Transcript_6742:215-1222(+)|eukprot:CAMPEP_0198204286 /NCGR_PEP_ID=MMETSP1445-20131203/7688_1 /TAXON_ID=36898 /ORGANISM="Pyramimonas sp., Strain CCMP2087" /LENGTH=335 /DNA_ID=CAMNT_0043876091 /DNA_START=211 /DNA_END=1218 /DNA_ORIENTATION=-
MPASRCALLAVLCVFYLEQGTASDLITTIAALHETALGGCKSRGLSAADCALEIQRVAELPSGGLVAMPRRIVTVELSLCAVALNIEGDFVETGVYTGGTLVLMMNVLQRFGSLKQRTWAADSFQGLPEPVDQDIQAVEETEGEFRRSSSHPGKKGRYASTLKAVYSNLRRNKIEYSGEHLTVLKGWFTDTLPKAPIEKIAFLRLDGDMYISTIQPLEALYDKVTVGGFIYVDDYGSFAGCKRAVDEFRAKRGITEEMVLVAERGNTFEAVFWQKRHPNLHVSPTKRLPNGGELEYIQTIQGVVARGSVHESAGVRALLERGRERGGDDVSSLQI